jgi:nucleoid-associated protein YgaU
MSPIALRASPAGTVAKATSTRGANNAAQMARAQLTLYEPTPLPGGGSETGAPLGAVIFQFNPKEVTVTKSASWQRKTTKGSKMAGPPEFTGPEPSKMTLEMFFDATPTRDGSVVAAVEKLLTCCVATEMSESLKKPTPPLVILHWGSISSFPAFITSVSAKFTLFSAGGLPIRAVCTVSLEEMPSEKFRKQNPTSGSKDVRRVHRTIAGDSLASVAYAEYGDPAAWRTLATFNGIDDPLRVRTGTVLLLPSPEDLASVGSTVPTLGAR